MRIRILQQTSISGQPVRVGQVLVDANDSDARTLLAMKKAELLQDLDPVVITEDTAPVLRKPRARKG
jgi:hypothetical protein